MNFFMKLFWRFAGESPELIEFRNEKGICDEYVELFHKIYPNPNKKRQIELADVLTSLGRYDEAEALLKGMKISFLDDDDIQGTYYHTLLTLYIETHCKEKGLAVFREQQRFLDIYFGSPARRPYAAAYYDNAAVILAMNGYTDHASDYFRLEQQWVEQNQDRYPASVYYPPITHVHMLTALGKTQAAWQEAVDIRSNMEHFAFKTAPQREALFRMLDKALQ